VRHLQKKRVSEVDNEKVLALSAYTSGVLLLMFALFIIVEAAERFFNPAVEIRYVEAMIVAVIGMVVNIICAFVLHEGHEHQHEDDQPRIGDHQVVGQREHGAAEADQRVPAHSGSGLTREPAEEGEECMAVGPGHL
jgi:Co/Zn/Cd efflux system component